jgi:hypothetical protein
VRTYRDNLPNILPLAFSLASSQYREMHLWIVPTDSREFNEEAYAATAEFVNAALDRDFVFLHPIPPEIWCASPFHLHLPLPFHPCQYHSVGLCSDRARRRKEFEKDARVKDLPTDYGYIQTDLAVESLLNATAADLCLGLVTHPLTPPNR